MRGTGQKSLGRNLKKNHRKSSRALSQTTERKSCRGKGKENKEEPLKDYYYPGGGRLKGRPGLGVSEKEKNLLKVALEGT